MKLSKRNIVATTGSPEQFKAALEDKIAELHNYTSDVHASQDADFANVEPGTERYFLYLKQRVVDILTKSFGLDATATFESFGIRFEVYVPGTYDCMFEDVLLYEDFEPNMADIEADATQLCEYIVENCNADDSEDDDDILEEL